MLELRQQVGFVEAVRLAFRRYADFAGRSTRAEFWWYLLFHVLVLSVCNVFTFVDLGSATTLGAVLSSLFTIATLLPFLAVTVRRLRDAGEGWGHVFWLLVPVGGLVILAIYLSRPSQAYLHEEAGGWAL